MSQKTVNTPAPPHFAAPTTCLRDGIASTYAADHSARGTTVLAI